MQTEQHPPAINMRLTEPPRKRYAFAMRRRSIGTQRPHLTYKAGFYTVWILLLGGWRQPRTGPGRIIVLRLCVIPLHARHALHAHRICVLLLRHAAVVTHLRHLRHLLRVRVDLVSGGSSRT